uniref:Uncharacterized protein n=1 Tax=Plectus sambesii TaxID=2011161 RepID=A0A914VBQ8_9BILA
MKRTVEYNGSDIHIPAPKLQRIHRRQMRTQLDNLVVENCVSKLHYIERIFFERVSRSLADILRSTYKWPSISLEIDSFGKFKNRYIFSDPTRAYREDEMQRVGFEFYEVRLKSAVHLIFSRYKRVHSLRINSENIRTFTESFLAVLEDERCRPTDVQQLTYSLNFCTEIDSRLILQFSPLLKCLKLDCPLPLDMCISEKLWSAVGQCSKLDRLSICSLNTYLFDITEECWTHMRECLKRLKIRIFHSGMGAKSFSAEWLADALQNNERLRILSLDDHYDNIETFSDPVLAPVVSRLRTVTVDF